MNVKLVRKDGSSEVMTADELAAIRDTLNNLVHNGDDQDGVQPVKREITDAQQADADARAAEAAVEQAKADAIASIYAPVTYNGKDYPADLQSLAKYEVAKQARGRSALTKGIAIATDGTVTKLSTVADIAAFHAAIEAAVTARIEAVHDLL